MRNTRTQNFFPLPNEIFCLGLASGEIAVYAYLMYCEDRTTFKCYPSYQTIGEAVGMAANTVGKYVKSLEQKRLIATAPTTVKTKDGRVRNGSLEYNIRPIQEAVDYYDEWQMREFYRLQAEANTRCALERYERKYKNHV